MTAERDPAKLPWKELGVDIVMECTGIFTKREQAAKHLEAGAKRVLVSAPADGVDLTVVYGVNHDALKKEHTIVSNASCTTNCLAPVAYVMHEAFGIERGYMTTIHSYTGDQPTVDTLHKDLRRARAAALSMIPTSTGAAKAVGLVMPDLKGKLDGTAIRVPTANVSLIDFKFVPKKVGDAKAVNAALIKASESNRLKGILMVTDEELVSCDFNHNPASSTVDLEPDAGDRQRAGARAVLVRQRVGLLQPHVGHRRGDGEADLARANLSSRRAPHPAPRSWHTSPRRGEGRRSGRVFLIC